MKELAALGTPSRLLLRGPSPLKLPKTSPHPLKPTGRLATPLASPVKGLRYRSDPADAGLPPLTAQALLLFGKCRLQRECRAPCLTRRNIKTPPRPQAKNGLRRDMNRSEGVNQENTGEGQYRPYGVTEALEAMECWEENMPRPPQP